MTEIEITFSGDNDITGIEAEEGATIEDLVGILSGIKVDPIWLQSPVDRQTDNPTVVTVDTDDLSSEPTDLNEIFSS
jgi:hypothetical protein